MCQTLPGRWSVPFLFLLSTGCATSSLQLLHDPPAYVTDVRAEYFSANPDSPYRDNVTRGTVVPGMGRFDVLASWGHPERRVRQGPGLEEWTYLDVDADSGDALEYSLVFRNGLLDRWSTHTHKSTGLAYRNKTEEETKIVPAEPPAGKRVPNN